MLQVGGDLLGKRFLSLGLFNGTGYRFLGILSGVCVRYLPRLHSPRQLCTHRRQLLLKLLPNGSGAILPDILKASHNILRNDVLHRFHATTLLKISRQR